MPNTTITLQHVIVFAIAGFVAVFVYDKLAS